MEQQYLILGIIILTIALNYMWAKTRKQDQFISKQPLSNMGRAPEYIKNMKIKREDIEQSTDTDEHFYDLIQKYYPSYDDDSFDFDKLDKVTQTFVLITDAYGQINNGGIIQFIDNSTGNRFHETIDAANRINSKIFIELLTRAAEQFPNGQIPKDWDERRNLYDESCEKYICHKSFDELNSEEREIVLINRIKFGDITPLDQCSYEEKNSWSDSWEEIDRLYNDNSKIIIQNLIDYLKNNATLID